MASWNRYCSGAYEVSSKGDSRFSALRARLTDGRTIEEAYQLDVKGYRATSNNWRAGKGKPPLIKRDLWPEYLGLWKSWAEQNPALIDELEQLVVLEGIGILTDCFATTSTNQARALADILNAR
jgi:hypothetical protein